MNLAEATAVLNRVFEDYLLPVEFSQVQMELHLEVNDIDRSLSPIWYADDGTLVAAATLGVRAKRGWIGGFGVAPPHRGRGVAGEILDTVLEVARRRGLASVGLEVLTGNARAIRTYERGGFVAHRKLESSRWPACKKTVTQAALVSAAPFLARHDTIRPCWQRETASLRRQPELRAVSLGQNDYAIFRHDRREAQILRVEAQSSDCLAALAASIAETFELEGVSLFNEPAESPIGGFARVLKWQVTFEQHEMLKVLA